MLAEDVGATTGTTVAFLGPERFFFFFDFFAEGAFAGAAESGASADGDGVEFDLDAAFARDFREPFLLETSDLEVTLTSETAEVDPEVLSASLSVVQERPGDGDRGGVSSDSAEGKLPTVGISDSENDWARTSCGVSAAGS